MIIPNGVINISEEAFFDCFHLISVTIPNSVTSINEDAFSYCMGLTEIKILNPKCEIHDFSGKIDGGFGLSKNHFKGTIYGYTGSTAQTYAEKDKCKFVSLGEPTIILYELSESAINRRFCYNQTKLFFNY